MKKTILLSLCVGLLATFAIQAGELDLGASIIPLSLIKGAAAGVAESAYGSPTGFFEENLIALHAGYSLAFLYASADAHIMPAWWVYGATGYADAEGIEYEGLYARGFLSMLDVGIRPVLGSIALLATAGINVLYIPEARAMGNPGSRAGVNLRLGVGYQGERISIMLVGMALFPDFGTMVSVLRSAFQGDEWARESMRQSLIPSIGVNIHFPPRRR